MSYSKLWRILDHSLKDLKQGTEIISPEVLRDLHSAHTLIQILKVEPSHLEIIPQIEAYLANVEAYVVYTTQREFGQHYVKNLMEKIKTVREDQFRNKRVETGSASRFVIGVPRDKPWMRIRVFDELPQKEIAEAAEEADLYFQMQDDGYALVSGDGEKTKQFVRKISEKLKQRRTLSIERQIS